MAPISRQHHRLRDNIEPDYAPAMVSAMAVPKKKAARKLKSAAEITASLGESTRFETMMAKLLEAL